MPRGDRDILKADIEDGYTKLANLILEALAASKMNGVQKGICLFVLRRTYSWGKKEDRITLNEFAEATDSSRSYVSTQIKALVEANVILRPEHLSGKTPLYSFNTRVTEWRKGFANVKRLQKSITEGLYKCATEGLRKCETLHTEEPQEPSGFPGSLNNFKERSSNSSSIGSGVVTLKDAVEFYQKHFPMLNPYQHQTLQKWEERGMAPDAILYSMERAALAGKLKYEYVEGTISALYAQGALTRELALKEEELFKKQKGGITGEQSAGKQRASPRGRGPHQKRAGPRDLSCIIISGAGDEASNPG